MARPDFRSQAAQRLAAERTGHTPALIDLLRDEDVFVRRDAAIALGKLGPKAQPASGALATAARDRNGHVRKAAAEALGKLDPKPAVGSATR